MVLFVGSRTICVSNHAWAKQIYDCYKVMEDEDKTLIWRGTHRLLKWPVITHLGCCSYVYIQVLAKNFRTELQVVEKGIITLWGILNQLMENTFQIKFKNLTCYLYWGAQQLSKAVSYRILVLFYWMKYETIYWGAIF